MDLLHDRYRIVAPLGEGGAGTTWRAIDTTTGAEVTVKKLSLALNATNEALLERETRLLGQLDHAQIPRFVQAFVDEFRMRRYLHLVLDFVPGEPLSAVMARRRFSQGEVRDLLGDLLGIIAWLHALAPPVIHRDIKPSNLILRPDGRIALIDFGLATDAIDKTFLHTMAVGTLGYQAPEQIAGDPCPASDVYSVGVVALELLTRASPRELLSGQTLRWGGRAAHLDDRWKRWLERALAPRVADRFTDGAAALAALRGQTEREPAATGRGARDGRGGRGGGSTRSSAAGARRAAVERGSSARATSAGSVAVHADGSATRPAVARTAAAPGERAPNSPARPSYAPGAESVFKHFFPGSNQHGGHARQRGARPDINPVGAFILVTLLAAIVLGPLLFWDKSKKTTAASAIDAAPAQGPGTLRATAACRAGDHHACREAAQALRTPRADGGVPDSNEQLARALLVTGCQGGHAPSCVELADIHGYTHGGARWFARGCALGHASACHALTLLSGDVVLRSADVAPLEAQCAPTPDATAPSEACQTLATLHRTGRVSGGGPFVARRLLERACSGGGCTEQEQNNPPP